MNELTLCIMFSGRSKRLGSFLSVVLWIEPVSSQHR